jgi:hypothetical protein
MLNENEIMFQGRNFKVLAQPTFDDGQLYWKSIDDFLQFAKAAADARLVISGRFLCGLFNEAKPEIMKISDFENPNIPFESILTKYVRGKLDEARDFAIENLQQTILSQLSDSSLDELRKGSPSDLMVEQIKLRHATFKNRAGELYPHILQLFPEMSRDLENEIDATIHHTCASAFLAVCAERLIPECKTNIFNNIKTQIEGEMAELDTPNVGVYNFSQMISRYVKHGTSELRNQLLPVDQDIVSLRQFERESAELQAAIEEFIDERKQEKWKKYEVYQQEETEKFKKELARELEKVREEDREELRKVWEASNLAVQEMKDRTERLRLDAEQREKEHQEETCALEARMKAERTASENIMLKDDKELHAVREEMSRREKYALEERLQMVAENSRQLATMNAQLAEVTKQLHEPRDKICPLL